MATIAPLMPGTPAPCQRAWARLLRLLPPPTAQRFGHPRHAVGGAGPAVHAVAVLARASNSSRAPTRALHLLFAACRREATAIITTSVVDEDEDGEDDGGSLMAWAQIKSRLTVPESLEGLEGQPAFADLRCSSSSVAIEVVHADAEQAHRRAPASVLSSSATARAAMLSASRVAWSRSGCA